MKQLDAIMDQGRGVMVSEITSPLKDFVDRAASVLPGAMDRAFLACDNHAVPSFGREYFKRNRAELHGILKLAYGSKALAGFQRFGPYQRLKSLYVRRWALRRRLISISRMSCRGVLCQLSHNYGIHTRTPLTCRL